MDDKKIIFSMVNVSKSYNPGKTVLKNIYLSFYYGAKIGVLGLNGEADRQRSVELLQAMGVKQLDLFTYRVATK